jgi:hypothetical protein
MTATLGSITPIRATSEQRRTERHFEVARHGDWAAGWLTFALEEALDDICKPGREDQGGDAMGGEKLRDE